jgi:hypothetical protein
MSEVNSPTSSSGKVKLNAKDSPTIDPLHFINRARRKGRLTLPLPVCYFTAFAFPKHFEAKVFVGM